VGDAGRHLAGHRELFAARELAPGREQALRALRQLAVRLLQLFGGALHLAQKSGVEVADALQHRVQAPRHRAHLVVPADGGARREVARGSAAHRPQEVPQRRKHEVPRQRVQHADQHQDGEGREEQGGRADLVAHALDRLHGYRDDDRAVRPVVALEGDGHQVRGPPTSSDTARSRESMARRDSAATPSGA
jgi:hypothetical protein